MKRKKLSAQIQKICEKAAKEIVRKVMAELRKKRIESGNYCCLGPKGKHPIYLGQKTVFAGGNVGLTHRSCFIRVDKRSEALEAEERCSRFHSFAWEGEADRAENNQRSRERSVA